MAKLEEDTLKALGGKCLACYNWLRSDLRKSIPPDDLSTTKAEEENFFNLKYYSNHEELVDLLNQGPDDDLRMEVGTLEKILS